MNAKNRNFLIDLSRGFGLLAVLLALAAGAFLFTNSDWVHQSTTDRLAGATQAEVRQLLGEPTDMSLGLGDDRWRYRRPWHFAEFRVDFDDTGRVAGWSYDR